MTASTTTTSHGTQGRRRLPLVVFDGDDTLWITERLYDEARSAAAHVVESQGLDPLKWEQIELDIDVRNVATMGLSAERFPTSCVQAYEALCREAGVPSNVAVANRIRATAGEVFHRRADLASDAENVLRQLRGSYRLVLLTQGAPEIQNKRIADSGLESLFDAIYIIPVKSVDVLRSVLDDLEATSDTSWLVGNSIPSDINPALACGMRAVWIDAHVWDHEKREAPAFSERMYASDGLAAVPSLVTGALATG